MKRSGLCINSLFSASTLLTLEGLSWGVLKKFRSGGSKHDEDWKEVYLDFSEIGWVPNCQLETVHRLYKTLLKSVYYKVKTVKKN